MRNMGCGAFLFVAIVCILIEQGIRNVYRWLNATPLSHLIVYALFLCLIGWIFHQLRGRKQQRIVPLNLIKIEVSQSVTTDLLKRLNEIVDKIKLPVSGKDAQYIHSEGLSIASELISRIERMHRNGNR